jgi:hypothetical protein
VRAMSGKNRHVFTRFFCEQLLQLVLQKFARRTARQHAGREHDLPRGFASSTRVSASRPALQETGIVMDYKDRYWKLLSDADTQGFTITKLWNQALNQVQAAGGRPIRWYFSEKQAADYVRVRFRDDPDRNRIDVVHVPNAGERQMNERTSRFTIHYRLPRRQETPAVIGAKLPDSLDALSRIDPLFTDWKILDPLAMASLPLAIARTRISTIVENNIVRDDYDQPEPNRDTV